MASQKILGASSGGPDGGDIFGTFTYKYKDSSHDEVGFNIWKTRTLEKASASANQIETFHYNNFAAQPIASVIDDSVDGTLSGNSWTAFNRYDEDGRVTLSAGPSAVDSVSESTDQIATLHTDAGLVYHFSYYGSGDGFKEGYLRETSISRGWNPDAPSEKYKQETLNYINALGRVDLQSRTVYTEQSATPDPENHITTTYAYVGVLSGSLADGWTLTTTLPMISDTTGNGSKDDPGQNGSGAVMSTVETYDDYGRLESYRDADGYTRTTGYDGNWGYVVTETIDSGGVGLATVTTYDALGRPTGITDPAGNKTTMDYIDTDKISVVKTTLPDGTIGFSSFDRKAGVSETKTQVSVPGVSEPHIISLSREFTDPAARLTEAHQYSDANTYGETKHYYDSLGRQHKTVNALATVYRTEYDALGRNIESYIGVGAAETRIESIEYDGDGVGDGNVTKTTQYPDDDMPDRVSRAFYDWRNRPVAAKTPHEDGAVVTYSVYDNLDRVIRESSFDLPDYEGGDVSDGVPDEPDDSKIRSRTEYQFDDLGRVYRQISHEVQPIYEPTNPGEVTSSHLPGNELVSNLWYDGRGNVIQSHTAGQAATKVTYDGAGRVTDQYSAVLVNHSYANASTIDNHIAIVHSHTEYDSLSNPIFVTKYERDHDAGAYVGLLTDAYARITYMANYYDAKTGEIIRTVNFGTNGGEMVVEAPGDPEPGRPAYDTVGRVNSDGWDKRLVTDFAYSIVSADSVFEPADRPKAFSTKTVIDPMGIVTYSESDMLGRMLLSIAAYDSTSGVKLKPGDDKNRMVVYTYDALGNVIDQTQMLPGGKTSTTTHEYGVSQGAEKTVYSNEPLYRTSNCSLDGERDIISTVYYYNALGQVRFKEEWIQRKKTQKEMDDAGDGVEYHDPERRLTHEYTYDQLGRQDYDFISGADLEDGYESKRDRQVQGLAVSYDTFGQPYSFRSLKPYGTDSWVIVNEVVREYGGFGQLIKEYQEHESAVDSSTPLLTYNYQWDSATNSSRLSSMIYPTVRGVAGRTITYQYAVGIDADIGRISKLHDSGVAGVVESYEYLGASTIVGRDLEQAAVTLNYYGGLTFDSAAMQDVSNGIKYKGLDRFGRVIRQAWEYDTPVDNQEYADLFHYGYTAGGGKLYKYNFVNEDYSELYHSDRDHASIAYDKFGRLIDFQRGKLEERPGASRYDSIEGHDGVRSTWKYDARGNWTAIYRDGEVFSKMDSETGLWSVPKEGSTGNNVASPVPGAPFIRKTKFDGWNRLKSSETIEATQYQHTGDQDITADVTYEYDALGRMIAMDADMTQTDFYHSAAWQTIVEATEGKVSQNVWSLAYVDAMVFQERPVSSGHERIYPLHDAAFDVTSLLRAGTNAVVQRYIYDPFGKVDGVLTAAWKLITSKSDAPLAASGAVAGILGVGMGWRYLHHGGFTSADQFIHFRNRSYDPHNGQWLQRDPAGFIDGLNLREYVGGSPNNNVDPSGRFLHILAGGVIGGLLGAGTYIVQAAFSEKAFSWAELGVYAGSGAAAGALGAATFGASLAVTGGGFGGVVLAGTVSGAASGALGGAITDGSFAAMNGQDWVAAALNGARAGAINGAVSGAFGGAIGSIGARLGTSCQNAFRDLVRTTLVGAAGGGLTGGAMGYLQTGTWEGAWSGARQGAIAGAVTSAAGFAVTKAASIARGLTRCFVAGTPVWVAPGVALATGEMLLPVTAAINIDPRFNNYYWSAAVLATVALTALGQQISQRKEEDRKRLEIARATRWPIDEDGRIVHGRNVVPAWA